MNLKPTLFLAAMLALTIWGAAQNPPTTLPPPAAPPQATPAVIVPAKIAFMRITDAIALCDEGKKEIAVLSALTDQKSAELQKMKKEIDALQNQLDITGSKLIDEARTDLANEIETKTTLADRFQQDGQKDLENRKTKLQNSIFKKMAPIIEKVAKEKGANIVQFVDTVQNLYGYIDTSLIITDDVVKAYNIQYPVAPEIKK